MSVKEIAIKMMDENSKERKEAEKMMGVSFQEMTQEQRRLAANCLAAFQGKY